VSGVGGDDEDGGANGGEENGENRTACGFADAAFAADEDPLESLLFQNVLNRCLNLIPHFPFFSLSDRSIYHKPNFTPLFTHNN